MKITARTCKGCYWNGMCQFEPPCSDYTPLRDELSDAEIDQIIERKRVEFRREWHKYIEENP